MHCGSACVLSAARAAERPRSYNDTIELEDAIHTAILTLKDGFEGQMTSTNVEIGVVKADGFHLLTPTEVSDYLSQVQ